MPQALPLLTHGDLATRLGAAGRIYVAAAAGEPVELLGRLAQTGLGRCTLVTAALPGINHADLTRLGPEVAVETLFVTPALRPGFARGQVRHRPLHYTEFYRSLSVNPPDVALLLVPPPRDGLISLGLAQDFPAAFLDRPTALYGAIHPELPWPKHGVAVPVGRFAGLIESGGAIAEPAPAEPDAAATRAAVHVAGLIRDGDTVQTGIGGVPSAVLCALRNHRRLGFHAGMLTAPVLDLADQGVLTGLIHAAVALGDAGFRDRIGIDDRVGFRPVGVIHAIGSAGALPGFNAVNSAFEVDLFGQVCAETIDGRQSGGHGGLVDFCRIARASEGGRAIIALTSTARRGAVSRIVPRLAQRTIVSVQRADVDFVVTEHGVADLREADVDGRARALIGIAAPAMRETLEQAWRTVRRNL